MNIKKAPCGAFFISFLKMFDPEGVAENTNAHMGYNAMMPSASGAM